MQTKGGRGDAPASFTFAVEKRYNISETSDFILYDGKQEGVIP